MKVLLLITMLLSFIFAQDIDIKGLKIGMTYEEANKLFDLKPVGKFRLVAMKNGKDVTFATAKVEQLYLEFSNNKIINIVMKLKSDDYNTVVAPLKEKYKMKCEKSIIENKIGAKFNQEECIFISNGIKMSIDKYFQNITDSLLFVSKEPTMEDVNKRAETAKKDI